MEFRDKPMQNLIRVKEKEICKNVQELLLDGEQIVGAYKTVRDQAVFTSHRIFIVDMQGVTGTRQEIFVLPYRKIVHFGIQTAGFGDPLQTSQLTVCYADEHATPQMQAQPAQPSQKKAPLRVQTVHLKVHPALPHQPQAHLLPKSVRKMLLRLQLQLKRVNLTH